MERFAVLECCTFLRDLFKAVAEALNARMPALKPFPYY
jgi:hypothetical protein